MSTQGSRGFWGLSLGASEWLLQCRKAEAGVPVKEEKEPHQKIQEWRVENSLVHKVNLLKVGIQDHLEPGSRMFQDTPLIYQLEFFLPEAFFTQLEVGLQVAPSISTPPPVLKIRKRLCLVWLGLPIPIVAWEVMVDCAFIGSLIFFWGGTNSPKERE